MSKEHLLFHKPFNPFCDGCNAAKMRDVQHFKGAFDRKQTFWGELLTCDHIDSRSNVGLLGDKQALIIKDLYSKLRDVHPAKTKEVIDTEWSIADFVGDRDAKKSYHHTMYSDQEEAIRTACKNLKIKSEFSQPGIPRNNSIIERSVGDLLEGSRTLLRAAGLPTSFWSWAAKCFCFHENIGVEDGDDTPWFLTPQQALHRRTYTIRLCPSLPPQ